MKRQRLPFLQQVMEQAQKAVIGGVFTGVFIPREEWDAFENSAKLSGWMTEPSRNGWTYTLSEEEVGMFALMSYQMENTPHPHDAPPRRFGARIPVPLQEAVEAFFDSRRNMTRYRNDGRWADMEVCNDHRFHGVLYTLTNGAEIVRIAKTYYQ